MRDPYRRLDEDDVSRMRQMDEDYASELDGSRDPKMQDAGRDQAMQMEALMRQMMQMTQDCPATTKPPHRRQLLLPTAAPV